MGYVVGLEIKVTSPLTHNISGGSKACLQTLLATIYYHTAKPFLWWVGTLTVLVGTCSYSVVKSMEMKKQQQQNEATRQAVANTINQVNSEKQPLLSEVKVENN